jgi:predicted amidohydrolase
MVEKHNLTLYERDVWRLAPGNGLAPIPDSRLGVTICYDAEFPEAGRVLLERGTMVQVVPAFTEDVRGFQRVRWCAKARAIENQAYVVHASLVGDLGREPVPSTYGTTAILTPSQLPFPENAVLGETQFGEEDVIVRTLDLDLLVEARRSADIRNWRDRTPATESGERLQREDESA